MGRARTAPPTDRPWRCWIDRGWLIRTFDSGMQARRWLDREYRAPGYRMVRNFKTGETWERRGGSWTCKHQANKRAKAAAGG